MTTVESKAALQVVQNSYAAFGAGDMETLLSLQHEDVVWVYPGVGLPLSGTYNGQAGVISFFQGVGANEDIQALEPREFIADGDKVVVLGYEKVIARSTGRPYECNFAHVWTVRDGKIVRMEFFLDTEAVAAAYRS
jgi:uncharacterized protein